MELYGSSASEGMTAPIPRWSIKPVTKDHVALPLPFHSPFLFSTFPFFSLVFSLLSLCSFLFSSQRSFIFLFLSFFFSLTFLSFFIVFLHFYSFPSLLSLCTSVLLRMLNSIQFRSLIKMLFLPPCPLPLSPSSSCDTDSLPVPSMRVWPP